jgi:tetratricopeptide (TPR) repeat protein
VSEPAQEDPEAPLPIGGRHIEPGERIGQYVYRRQVGRGGMAHVVLATDPDGQPVALKILKSGRVGSGAQRFRREFRALARLRHPNVIRVEAYGDVHGHPYIAMEYIEGSDLHQLIHAMMRFDKEVRWARCEEVLADVARALVYIHSRGLVHRDLKPSNVLIDKNGRCKLTDFGIVKDLGPENDSMVSTTLVGTWAYASPEQVNGHPIDHRSDLFSLGIILFAMLTGRRPFMAKDLSGYIELHRTHVAPAPADVDPEIPAHLDDICRRLMQREPARRPRGAQEVLYRLSVKGDPFSTPAASWSPPTVGRGAAIDALNDAVAALTRREGGLVAVEGDEGSGRSRMLEQAADAARIVGLGVHRTRVQRPDGALGPVLRLVASVKEELPENDAEHLAALDRLALAAAGGGTARTQLYAGLAEALAQLASRRPQVVLVDDVHLALLPALDGILHVVRALATEPVLFVVSIDPDLKSPRLDALRAIGDSLPLAPLDEPQTVQLAASLLGNGKAAQAIGSRLYAETGGNCGATVEWLQSLVSTGVVEKAARGWRLVVEAEEVARGHLDVPPSVVGRIRPRLDSLDLTDRAVADALAVYGREVEIEVVTEVLGIDEETALDTLVRLDQDGIARIRSAGPTTWASLARPLIATVLYRSLDPDRRASLHRSFAQALQATFGHTVASAERVADHWARAGETGRAYRELAEGARKMRERGLNAEAWELCERAGHLEDTARVDLTIEEFAPAKQTILLVRAEVWYLRGTFVEAREALEQAASLADQCRDEAGAVRARMRLSRVLRTSGMLDQAESMVVANLARARDLGERESIAEGLIVRAHIAWSRGDLDRCEQFAQEGLLQASAGHSPRARADLLMALTAVQASRGQMASAASGLSEAAALFRDLRMHGMRASALANLAEVELGQGDPVAAWDHGADAIAEVEAEGAGGTGLPGIGARRIRGLAALELGAWSLAAGELEAALQGARELSLQGEVLACSVHLARTRLAAGDPRGALDTLKGAESVTSAGDPERFLPVVRGLRARAHAALREAPAARQAVAAAEADLGQLPPLRRVEAALDIARAQERLGDATAALPLAQSAARLAQSRGFRILSLDATALAARVCADAAESNRLSREAQAGYAAIQARLPAAWQATFRSRGGGA